MTTPNAVGTSVNLFAFFEGAVQAYREPLEVRREIAQIDADTRAAIAQLERESKLLHHAVSLVFDDRRSVIDRHFDLIDRGVATGDRELVAQGSAAWES